MVDVVKKMLDLHSELGDAQESRAFALSAKGNAENAQTENKEKEKRLQSVKTEFLKKLEAYNTIRG